jgi:hypothetical protein
MHRRTAGSFRVNEEKAGLVENNAEDFHVPPTLPNATTSTTTSTAASKAIPKGLLADYSSFSLIFVAFVRERERKSRVLGCVSEINRQRVHKLAKSVDAPPS